MKVGDTLPVTVQGIVVAQAIVEAVEPDKVTFVVPGTRVQAGIRTVLEQETPVGETERIIDGVDRVDNSSAPTEANTAQTEASVEPAKPVDTPVEPVSDKPVEPVADKPVTE